MMLRLLSHSPRLSARLEKLKSIVSAQNLKLIIIFKPENLFYLTGFRGSAGALVVFRDRAVLVVDSRYEEQAEMEAANVEILGSRSIQAALKDLLVEAAPAKAGFETNGLTYAEYELMKRDVSSPAIRIELVPARAPVEGLRLVKDFGEIDDLTKAAGLADACLEHLVKEIKPGVTERALANQAQNFLKEKGAEDESFETIVASGANSSMPHASSTDKKLERGDLVLIDLGAIVNGYHSDITRTFVIGKPTSEQLKMYGAVLEAHDRVLDKLKPGQAAGEADEICRSYLYGYGGRGRFLHSLGHGVGLEIHERPQLGAGSTDELKKGMVFTVEPGLYARGLGGVRIEDMVALEDTPRLLTGYPREFITI